MSGSLNEMPRLLPDDSLDDDDVVSKMRLWVFSLALSSSMLAEQDFQQALLVWITLSLQQEARDRLVDNARQAGSQVLQAYMSDGWGCNVAEMETLKCPGNKRSLRERHRRQEFLLERVILKARNTLGDVAMAFLSPPARRMLSKGGWTVFGASLTVPILRELIPEGIVQSAYIQDGLHFQSFLRRQRARHRMFYDENLLGVDENSNWVARTTDWVWGFWCVLHVLSLALKWSLKPWFSVKI